MTVLVASKPLCLGDAAEKAGRGAVRLQLRVFAGTAIAEAIFGILNPSGRLPISFPRHSGQLPVYYNYLPGWHGHQKYCDLPADPLFTFGEGIGYAPFTYANLTFDVPSLTAAVDVTNAGKVAGTETVQVYFGTKRPR